MHNMHCISKSFQIKLRVGHGLYNDNTRLHRPRRGASLSGVRRGFSTNSGTMGGVEKARQRGIPRFYLRNMKQTNILKGTPWIPSIQINFVQMIYLVLCRLKEAPMEERELEIVDLGGKETSEERVKRIKETSVTFKQFVQCIDLQMLRVFASLLLFMIGGGVVVTFFYLLIIYTFKFAMWEFYFPKQPFDQMKTELWNALKRNWDFLSNGIYFYDILDFVFCCGAMLSQQHSGTTNIGRLKSSILSILSSIISQQHIGLGLNLQFFLFYFFVASPWLLFVPLWFKLSGFPWK